MPRHFAGLRGAAILPTNHFQLVGRIIGDLVDFQATGVVHGPAGTGKTYAVEAALEALRDGAAASIATVSLAFPSRPTMRLVADELLRALTGSKAPSSRSRFYLTAALTDLLTAAPRLVVDEAQRLTGDCIELLRHLHDHPDTRFALLYVGGDGCWEVLSREPMLRSRVFRRLPFQAIKRAQVPTLMRGYHPIYADRSPEYAAYRARHLELERELRLCGLIRDKGVPTKAEASADVQYSLRLTRGDHLGDPENPFAEPPWWRRPRLDDGQHLQEQLYGSSDTEGEPWPDPSPPDLSWLDDRPPAEDHSA
ncbi:AAA family ATPase [Nonomuraea sp. NPDC059194]|uniref:AAA family ATPase n=1 Tax=Nonomuraea sp. NPDC059194 TaxID=3346764 RepID=UPI0036A81985